MKKSAVVTGGTRGIGYAVSQRLGKDGFRMLLVSSSDPGRYEEQLEALTNDGIEWNFLRADIGSHDDRLKIVEEAVRLYGRIDVLVNNAGVAPNERRDLLEMTEESFDRVVGINTKGNMFLTQAVARQMLKQTVEGRKRGSIINISSCSAEAVSTNRGEYCVSKAGISMLTLLYAARLAKEGIYVNEVRPGVIATDMTAAVRDKYDRLIGNGIFPIARWGTPEDVADAVALFAGDHFLYTTGSYVDVDGGFHIRSL